MEGCHLCAGELTEAIKPEDCYWDLADGKVLEIALQKQNTMQWWKGVLKTDPEICTQKVILLDSCTLLSTFVSISPALLAPINLLLLSQIGWHNGKARIPQGSVHIVTGLEHTPDHS